MKYMIREEGGFLGFPRDYIGEVPMGNEEAQALLSDLSRMAPDDLSGNVDALYYIVELEHEGERHSGAFSEKNLPASLRDFLHSIRDNR